MIREIKFRGWSVIESKWVYGSLLQSEIDVNELNVKCQIHERFANDFGIAKYDVIPETVGQFAGLKDKNGKDIYEWDILQTKPQTGENVNQIVEFIDGCFSLKAISSYVHREPRDWAYSCVIIGNIYQNPELLETVVLP